MELIEVNELKKRLSQMVKELNKSSLSDDEKATIEPVLCKVALAIAETPKLTVSELPRKICDNGVMRYMTEEEQKAIEALEEGEGNEQHADLGWEEVSRSDR